MPGSEEPKQQGEPGAQTTGVHTARVAKDLWMSALKSAVTKPPWREADRYRNSLLRG